MKDDATANLVLSVDSLHGTEIDTRISGPWRNVPPIPRTKILKGVSFQSNIKFKTYVLIKSYFRCVGKE